MLHPPSTRTWAIAGAGLGSIGLTLATASVAAGAMQESAAEWLGALATLAGFLAASVAAVFAARAYQRQADRDIQQAERELRSQAELVAAWPDYNRYGRIEESERGISIAYRNASALPVTDVTARVLLGKHYLGTLPQPFDVEEGRLAFLPPGEPMRRVLEFKTKPPRPAPEDLLEVLWLYSRVELSFRDAAGRKWRRSSDGVLERLAEDQPT